MKTIVLFYKLKLNCCYGKEPVKVPAILWKHLADSLMTDYDVSPDVAQADVQTMLEAWKGVGIVR